MAGLLSAALAPALLGMFYIYIRDKYEKEPVALFITGVLYGVAFTYPIILTEQFINGFMPVLGSAGEAAYSAFLVASPVEEVFKFAVVFLLTWGAGAFNEPMDGIVYSVCVSLGFAGLENALYVFNPVFGGFGTALSRAVFSVPAHALFGVLMGYYFAIARFSRKGKRAAYITAALAVPYALHGIYDFILMADMRYYLVIFIPFVALLWFIGHRQIKAHLASSPFKKARGAFHAGGERK